MDRNITSRRELLLARIAGQNVDLSSMTPPVVSSLEEQLLLDIAERIDQIEKGSGVPEGVMSANVYDKDGLAEDIFAYARNAAAANSGYTRVGKVDFTSEYDTDKSELIQIRQNQAVSITFRNHNNGGNNWFNFVLMLQNQKQNPFKKTFFRADNYGGGDDYTTVYSPTPQWDWNTFMSEMDGALIRLTVERTTTTANVKFTILTESGKTYTHQYIGLNLSSWGADLWMYLTVEKAYIDIFDAQTFSDAPSMAAIAPSFETNEYAAAGKVVSVLGELYKFKVVHNALDKWAPEKVDKVHLSELITANA